MDTERPQHLSYRIYRHKPHVVVFFVLFVDDLPLNLVAMYCLAVALCLFVLILRLFVSFYSCCFFEVMQVSSWLVRVSLTDICGRKPGGSLT